MNMIKRHPLSRPSSTFLWMVGLALVLTIVYLRTLLPTVGNTGDTAKFDFVGYVLGTVHPPGYPTYLVLNHFFTRFFPFGELAYKANLLSAVLSIIASLFLFRILLLFQLKPRIAFFTAMTFGFTRTLWSQSVVAEVYTLNALFISITVYYLLKWNQMKETRYLLIACAFYAFSFGNHLIMITLLPGIFVLVLMTDRSVFTQPKVVIPVLFFILLGALQYSYLIWRYYDPTTRYLEMETPDLSTLWWAVTGGQFKWRMFNFPFTEVLSERIPIILGMVLREYLFLLPIAIFGSFQLRKNTAVNVFFLLCIVGNIFWSINYDIPDIFIYLIPAYFFMAILVGIGLQKLENFLPARLRILGVIAVAAVPIFFAVHNYRLVDQHYQTVDGKRMLEVIETMQTNAIIVPRGYRQREFLLYYVIGQGWHRNNLWVVEPAAAKQIFTYLRCNEPIYVRQLQKFIPVGLNVYCFGPEIRGLFEAEGFQMKRISEGLFRVNTNFPNKRVTPCN